MTKEKLIAVAIILVCVGILRAILKGILDEQTYQIVASVIVGVLLVASIFEFRRQSKRD